MTARAAALALAVVAGASCARRPAGPGLPIDRVLAHVRALTETIGPRPGGSPEAARAAGYVEAELTAAGAHPERHAVGEVFVPEVRLGARRFQPARTVSCRDDNLIARFGPDRGGALLVMAHYDTVPGAPGAADNGAAVAILLELGRELAAHPPPMPVWLAFTADEEVGLVGARKLAEELGDHVAFAIALDMIGLDGPLIVNGASELIRGDELRWLAGAADAAGVDLVVPAPHRIVSRWWPQLERADHGAFTRRGIRGIHLFNRGGATGERIYLAYHTPRDRVDQLSLPALAGTARLLRELVVRPPPPPSAAGDDLGAWLPIPGNVVVPRWGLVAAAIALVAAALLGLGSLGRRRTRGPGVLAAIAVWAGAALIVLAIERLVAVGYPAPWVHAPLRHELAAGLVLAGIVALAATAIARWQPWAGPDRYAVAAAAWSLALGIVALAIGAAELAWLWLVPAAAAAWLPRLGDDGLARAASGLVAALAIAPALALLSPDLLRELSFHGFLPDAVPITGWLALHGLTAALVIAHLAARVRQWGPGATFALPAAAVAAILIGVLALATYRPPCTAGALAAQRLSCELR